MTPDKYPVDEDIIDPDMRGEGGGCLLLTVFTLSLILITAWIWTVVR